MAYTCNYSYLVVRQQEDLWFKTSLGKNFTRSHHHTFKTEEHREHGPCCKYAGMNQIHMLHAVKKSKFYLRRGTIHRQRKTREILYSFIVYLVNQVLGNNLTQLKNVNLNPGPQLTNSVILGSLLDCIVASSVMWISLEQQIIKGF